MLTITAQEIHTLNQETTSGNYRLSYFFFFFFFLVNIFGFLLHFVLFLIRAFEHVIACTTILIVKAQYRDWFG